MIRSRLLRLACLTIVWVITANRASAQQTSPVTLALSKSSFKQLVAGIESQTSCFFYYDAATVDTVVVTINADKMPVQEVLSRVFAGTQLRFSIDASNRVFVTSKFQVQTSLPADFFSTSRSQQPGEAYQSSGLAQLGVKGPDTVTVNEENRLVEIGKKGTTDSKKDATLSGFVRDRSSGEPLPGATIKIGNRSVVANQVGFYSLVVPKGRIQVNITSQGMRELNRQVQLYSDGELNVEMQDYVVMLKTVTIDASQRVSTVKNLEMGVERLNIKTIKQVPVIFGQADILRTVLALPGVTSVGEASTGFNVRGGSSDQNLILFNDATIYNPSHFFGFFSAFNPEVVKGIELYKSSIPEKYGGRIASVLDVEIKDGNKKKFSGVGGIGPLTSNLTLEIPVAKEKTSLVIGGRTTYSDWILKTIPRDEFKGSKASFYDANLHLSHQLNKTDFISVTGYISQDKFRLGRDSTYNYGNRNVNAKWKHDFKNNTFAVFTLGYDSYHYGINSDKNPVNAYDLAFSINQTYLRADFTKSIGSKHRLSYGLNSILYKLEPGSYTPAGSQSLVAENTVQTERGLENALYFGDEYKATDKLSVSAGIRYSSYTTLGPGRFYNYADGVPKDVNNITDSSVYGSGKAVKTYHGPEVRVSARYLLGKDLSLKVSYNSLRQYIHMLSNTTAISPTDIWKLSDPNIKPQQGQQLSLGVYKNFPDKEIEISVEVYYKLLKNYLDYRSGAQLLLNQHIETDVLNSKGRAYGAEFLIKRSKGKLNGWVSYTYSRTELQTDDPLAVQPVNKGNYYPANFDRPHNVN
ncbi:MAG: TonB-dependent receptor, partial [Chitinophagaceae bacterium]